MLGPAALVELLLVLTALQKVALPGPATRALRAVGLRIPPVAVRLGAGAESVVGIGALASGRPLFTAGVAFCYAVFAAYVAVARGKGDAVPDCGCFGGPETPPTRGHLIFDVAAAAVAVAATIWPQPGLARALGRQPLAGVPLVGLVALGCWLSWVLLSVAPRTAAASSSRSGRPATRA